MEIKHPKEAYGPIYPPEPPVSKKEIREELRQILEELTEVSMALQRENASFGGNIATLPMYLPSTTTAQVLAVLQPIQNEGRLIEQELTNYNYRIPRKVSLEDLRRPTQLMDKAVKFGQFLEYQNDILEEFFQTQNHIFLYELGEIPPEGYLFTKFLF